MDDTTHTAHKTLTEQADRTFPSLTSLHETNWDLNQQERTADNTIKLWLAHTEDRQDNHAHTTLNPYQIHQNINQS